MYESTDFEQEMLELVNRARLDPLSEYDALMGTSSGATGVATKIRNAIDLFNVDLDLFRDQLADLDAVAPLAWSSELAEAARGHSAQMIAFGSQSHQFPAELGLGARVTAAGYEHRRTVAENVFAYTDNPVQGHAGFFIDWGNTSAAILKLTGHRLAILNGIFTDVGISTIAETDSAAAVDPWVMIQNFGTKFTSHPQLVEVVLQDIDGHLYYDAAEGLDDLTITATNAAGDRFVRTSWGCGGYQIELAGETYEVVFSGGELVGNMSATETIANENVKLDGFAVQPNLEFEIFAAGAVQVNTLKGTANNDWLTLGTGDNIVLGEAGTDMVSFVRHSQAVNINLRDEIVLSGEYTNRLDSIENATGTIFGDYIQGNDTDNLLRGLGGYDWFIGSEGSDTFEGGSGRDMISYVFSGQGVTVDLGKGIGGADLAEQDIYESIERVTGSVHNDLTFGSDGEDDFRGLGGYDWFVGSGGGKDRYDGGSGLDTISYALSTEGVKASLLTGRGSSGDAAHDLYTSIERLTGSSFDDILSGDHNRNELRGLFGEDALYGNGGVDRLTGGGADDYLDGGAGFDYAIYENIRADYTVIQRDNHATVQYNGGGGEGTDTLLNIEALIFADDLVFL